MTSDLSYYWEGAGEEGEDNESDEEKGTTRRKSRRAPRTGSCKKSEISPSRSARIKYYRRERRYECCALAVVYIHTRYQHDILYLLARTNVLIAEVRVEVPKYKYRSD